MKLKRMISLAAALALLALVAVPAAADADKEKYEEKFQKVEKLPLDGKVYLSNISGDIKVLTANREEVKIDALKTSKADSLEKAKANAALVTIEVSRRDGRLEIVTKYPEGHKKDLNVSVKYDLTIPAKADIEVRDVSGDVRAENIGGHARLNSVSGDVSFMKGAMGGHIVTVSGDLDLADIKGDVKTKTVSGDITVNNLVGSVGAETVSGDIELEGISGAKSVDVNVISGDVTFDGALEKDGRYSLQSHSGDIDIYLPENSAFEFSCRSFSGGIKSDFKVIVELMGSLKHARHDVRGEVNGGGAELNLETFSGDINLNIKR